MGEKRGGWRSRRRGPDLEVRKFIGHRRRSAKANNPEALGIHQGAVRRAQAASSPAASDAGAVHGGRGEWGDVHQQGYGG